ncbi:kinase-like domain-containing protein [Mycena olivaceomarginata]|nr:kinase-like domain-containing protein [Mycena olivaceomarginata]
MMRVFQTDDVQTLLEEFSREAVIWRQLCHPNLLPFFGLYYLENRLCLVSPWMENGNIMEFLKFDPPHSIRLSLILDVALGLEYLHEINIVHGDLKGPELNKCTDQCPCNTLAKGVYCRFWAVLYPNALTLRLTTTSAPARGGTARYQAPELFQGKAIQTFETDIYAFGCVCYELNGTVMFAVVIEKQCPTQPLSCSGTIALDSLWELLKNCWDGQAQMRPSPSQIVKKTRGISDLGGHSLV